jgi:histidinol-phosphate/aromatic aminotransferase/cobyric acid decarboxylase-like protein
MSKARQHYVRVTRRLLANLAQLPGAKAHPSAANFALLAVERFASEVATELLVHHGVYVRDCVDKWGLDGGRYVRVAARTEDENRQVVAALTDVLKRPVIHPSATPAQPLAA